MAEKFYEDAPSVPRARLEDGPNDAPVGGIATKMHAHKLSDMVPPHPPPTQRAATAGKRRVSSAIDSDIVHAALTDEPTSQTFKYYWDQLDEKERCFVTACLRHTYISDVIKTMQSSKYQATNSQIKALYTTSHVANAVYQGLLLRMETKKARQFFIQGLLSENNVRRQKLENVETLLLTDKDHLQQMAAELDTTTGDGKRGIVKELIAYGMQARKVSDAEVNEVGHITIPAVFSLADPKMALAAIQELNKMDHEYGQDDKATSSIESQAERIKRIRSQMTTRSKAQAKKLGGVAKVITEAELEEKEEPKR